MAYVIKYDDEYLFDPYVGEDTVTDATITATINASSYFDFTITRDHRLYNTVKERSGIVSVYFDSTLLFMGEITSIEEDFYGSKTISCVDPRDQLSNVLLRPYSTVEGEQANLAPSSVDGYFQWLIDQYNDGMINAKFKLDVGVNQGAYLDKNNHIYRENDQFPTVASELEDKILDSLGGYLAPTYPNGSPTLNLYSDVHEANTQIIDFGVNLLDFSKETATSDQYTAIRPVGGTPERDSDESDAEEPEPVTLEPLGDGVTSVDSDYIKRGDVVYCLSAVNRYGYKEYNWSEGDTLDPQELLEKAVAELKKNVEPKLTIEVSAVDMALFAEGYDHLECGQVARVRSKPHGIDEYLMVSSVDIDLQDPSQTKYTLGQAFDSLTGEQSSYVKSLNSGINSSLDSVAALDQTVKDQASQIGSVEQIANDAKDTATNAQTAADNAQNTANSAQQAAQDAQNSASSALDKAEAAEGAVSEIQGMIEDINSGAEQAKQDAAQAKADAQQAAAKADAAAEKADSYQQQITDVTTIVNGVAQEVEGYTAQISGAVQDAEAALTATTALATDLNGFKTQVNQTYATKDALNQEVLNRQSAIEQTASSITQIVSENYTELKGYSDAAQSTAEEALSAANQANSDLAEFTSTVTGDLADLQDQIDGNIATWFYAGTPTLTNEPAVNWTTTEEKNQHLGDLYYDTNNGYAWRFMVQNGSYSWGRITDSDVTKALEDAANAQDTADSKRRVFVSQPTPPYDIGDLWVQGENGDILRCATPRASGSYNASDWVLASKYTDDSALEVFEGQVADIYSTKPELETATDAITATVEENFEKSVLVKEADGGIIDCGDTAGMPLTGLTVYGQTRQNLWVNPSGTTNGLTLTANEDGSITLSGTTTGLVAPYRQRYVLRPGSTYTLSVDKVVQSSTDASKGCFSLEMHDSDSTLLTKYVGFGTTTAVTFTAPDGTIFARFGFYCKSGTTVSGTYRVMLNEGPEPQPWCPPGLNSVESLSVVSAGKNLYNADDFADTNTISVEDGVITVGAGFDGWDTTGIIRTFIPKGTKVSLKKEIISGESNVTVGFGPGLLLVDSTGRHVLDHDFCLYGTQNERTDTLPEDVYGFTAYINDEPSGEVKMKVQFEIADAPTEYEPPNITSTPIDLLGNKVSSLPDGTRDELVVDAGGNVVLIKNTASVVTSIYNGVNGTPGDEGSVYWRCNIIHGSMMIPGTQDFSNGYCDKFDVDQSARNGTISILASATSIGQVSVCVPKDISSTASAAKTLVEGQRPFELVYTPNAVKTIPLGRIDLPALPEQNAHVWISTGTQGLDPDIHATWYAENASALKNFASKAELKVESDQIKATVEETYSTKEEVSAVEDKANAAQDALDSYKSTVSTTYATKSEVTQTANSIKSEVSETYMTKTDASATYATKTSLSTVDQTVDGLKSTVSSNYTTLNNKFSSYYTKTEVDQKDSSIKSTVSSVQTTANNALEKASTVEQTADGLEVRLIQAEKDVDTAQSAANSAKTAANNAAKTATNYLKFDSSGLCVGDMTSGNLGYNTLLKPTGLSIRNGTTELASFTAEGLAFANGTIDYSSSGALNIRNWNSTGSYLSLGKDSGYFGIPNTGAGGELACRVTLHSNRNISFSAGGVYKQTYMFDGSHKDTYEIFGAKRLYYNASGTTGNITLSESAANFDFIDIFFRTNDNAYDSARVYSPNGKNVNLSSSTYKSYNDGSYIRNKTLTISGVNISVKTDHSGEGSVFSYNQCGAVQATNVILIYAVWGFK